MKLFPRELHEEILFYACILGIPATLLLFFPESGMSDTEYYIWGIPLALIGYVVYVAIQSALDGYE